MSIASDELEAAIHDAVSRGDRDGVVTLIASAPEKVRRQARPAIVRKYEDPVYGRPVEPTVQAAALAALGLATLPQLRQMFGLVEALAPCEAANQGVHLPVPGCEGVGGARLGLLRGLRRCTGS